MTIKQLADIAKKRLVHNHHSMLGSRRLVVTTRDTRRQLTATAKALSLLVGFHVHPMQVAAIMIEEMARGLE